MRRLPLLVLVSIVGLALAWACGKGEPAPKGEPEPTAPSTGVKLPMELPVLPGAGTEPVSDGVDTVLVSPIAVIVEGKQLVQIREGRIDPAELVGDAGGRSIPKLTSFVDALRRADESRRARDGKAVAAPGFHVGLYPAAPARLMFQVLRSLIGARITRIALLATAPGGYVTVPLTLPAGPPEPGQPIAKAPPLRMFMQVARDRLIVFSLSGVEGSPQQPALSLARGPSGFDLAQLRATLAAIVARRFAGGRRSSDDRQIIVKVDHELDIQQTLNVLAAVRAGDGGELFPDLLLATGSP